MEDVKSNNPLNIFNKWFLEAKNNEKVKDHTEMCLATCDDKGNPSARIVLLKKHDEEGFVFYTNYTGRKSEDIRSNSKAAICFYWPALEKQVRIEGIVEKVSDEESDEYFNSRPHESRVGAWTSKQSATLENRDKLLAELEANREKFKDEELTRPVFWGGWRIKPYYIEFWQAGEYRIHHRVLFEREDVTYSEWKKRLLYP